MPTRRRTIRSVPTNWIVGVLVAVLAIATVVLVALALQSVRPHGDDQPEPGFSAGPERTPPAPMPPQPSASGPASASPQPSATETAADAAYPRELERFFAIGTAGWWRSTAGACGAAAPLIEHSVDDGDTWDDVTPRYRGIAGVLTLGSLAGSEAEAVASVGRECETQALRTFTQGEFWQPYDDVLAASRYPDPADPASIVVPRGTVAAPCDDPRSFRAAGAVVALVCDGAAHVLADAGTWRPLPSTATVALTISGSAVLTAEVAPDCDGVAVTRWAGAGFTDGTALGCAVGADPAQPLALAARDDTALVWSGDALLPLD